MLSSIRSKLNKSENPFTDVRNAQMNGAKPSIEKNTQILRDISKNPHISQREIAQRNGVSLGKVNYAINSLMDKGYVKIQRFRESTNKRKYIYKLTPAGMFEMARRTKDFLKWKMREYEKISREIRELQEEINGGTMTPNNAGRSGR